MFAGVQIGDRRFWAVQALVLAIAAGHVTLEIGGSLLGWPPLYLIPVSTFFIPTMYASWTFGEKGGTATALWCWGLSLPSIFLLHTHAQQLGVSLQLGIMTAAVIVLGRSVDDDRRAHSKALAANARLRELNATMVASCHALDLHDVFVDTVRAIVRQPAIVSAWIVYAPNGWDSRLVIAHGGAQELVSDLPPQCLSVARLVIETGERSSFAGVAATAPASHSSQATAVVPVNVGGTVVAALGISRPGDFVGEQDFEQLDAIARQIGLAADNARHLVAERSAYREVASSRAALETYIQLAADAQEEERKRLARELHDETIQALVIVRGDLEATGPRAEKDPARLAVTIDALDDIIADLRRFCRDLRPSVLDDLGLAQALDSLTVELADRAGIDVSLTCEGADMRLDARTELILYRIAQEALRNVERHAAAAHAAVALAVEPDRASLRVTDDGLGFELRDDDARLTDAGHLGLLGMHERAKALGAVLTIDSHPGTGTLVEVLVPRR